MTFQWTAAAEAEFAQLWRDGEHIHKLKARFRISGETVTKTRVRLGLLARVDAGFWTQQREADAKRLYIDQGMSANETARQIGARSRNAVIGVAQRRGWLAGGRKQASTPASRPKACQGRPLKQSPHLKPAAVFGPVATLDPVEAQKRSDAQAAAGKKLVDAFAAPANDDAILLVERQFGQCSWPVGEPDRPANQLCCGQPVPTEMSRGVETYCSRHALRAIKRTTLGGKPDVKAYERSLRRYA